MSAALVTGLAFVWAFGGGIIYAHREHFAGEPNVPLIMLWPVFVVVAVVASPLVLLSYAGYRTMKWRLSLLTKDTKGGNE